MSSVSAFRSSVRPSDCVTACLDIVCNRTNVAPSAALFLTFPHSRVIGWHPLILPSHSRSRSCRSCRGTRLVKALCFIICLTKPSAFYLSFMLQSASHCACFSVCFSVDRGHLFVCVVRLLKLSLSPCFCISAAPSLWRWRCLRRACVCVCVCRFCLFRSVCVPVYLSMSIWLAGSVCLSVCPSVRLSVGVCLCACCV